MPELNVKQKYEEATDILAALNNRVGRGGFYIHDIVSGLYDFDDVGCEMDKSEYNNLIEKLEWQAIKLAEASDLVLQVALEVKGE